MMPAGGPGVSGRQGVVWVSGDPARLYLTSPNGEAVSTTPRLTLPAEPDRRLELAEDGAASVQEAAAFQGVRTTTMYALMGDGSVRFLKQTIDRSVYRRLGHRADGEPIDDDAY